MEQPGRYNTPTMTARLLTPLLLCVLCALPLSSCRLALHTLPDSVGRQDFQTGDTDKATVYRCDGVLYVAMEGYYERPTAGLVEGYDYLKGGGWDLWPELNSDKKKAEKYFYIPMSEQLVYEWNKRNKATARLRFERYVPGVLTEEQMKQKASQRVAQGKVSGKLTKLLKSDAAQKSFGHYALKPITIPLEIVDAVSVVPLSGAVIAAAAVSAAILIPSTQMEQAFESMGPTTDAGEPQTTTP